MDRVRPELPAWQLLLASAGWAALTLTLLALLGVGLPVLLVSTLVNVFPRAAFPLSTLVAAVLTIATVALLGRETSRRAADRPPLRKALMSGFGFALFLGVPALVIWFGYWLIVSTA
jgi:hypothetical protein